MFKKFLSVLLIGTMVLGLVACGGGSSSVGGNASTNVNKGIILTDSNIGNYLDITVKHNQKGFSVISFDVKCKSKNSLFKFNDVSFDIEIHKYDSGNNTDHAYSDAQGILFVDENGNGDLNIKPKNLPRVPGKGQKFYAKILSANGTVID